jgi:hypothetical protein
MESHFAPANQSKKGANEKLSVSQPSEAEKKKKSPYDRVDQASEDSFPASDPPSWWSGRMKQSERQDSFK